MEHITLSGTVIHGKKLGRTIGFPTANIDISKTPLSPGTYGFETRQAVAKVLCNKISDKSKEE